ncbi:MAG: DUF3021 family protein [Lachnospiraceae bacterium]
MLKRIYNGFANSVVCGLIVNLLINCIVVGVTGDKTFCAVAPEYLALFPSVSVAILTNIVLYGIIGAAFSGLSIIYEQDKIGFIVQNILYCVLTGLVWVPIVMLIWQLHKYPEAFWSTIGGFLLTYIIMSIVGYKIIKNQVKVINQILESSNA